MVNPRAHFYAEIKLAKLNDAKAALEKQLADPEVYEGPTARLQDLQVKHRRIVEAIATLEDAWLEAQGAVELSGDAGT